MCQLTSGSLCQFMTNRAVHHWKPPKWAVWRWLVSRLLKSVFSPLAWNFGRRSTFLVRTSRNKNSSKERSEGEWKERVWVIMQTVRPRQYMASYFVLLTTLLPKKFQLAQHQTAPATCRQSSKTFSRSHPFALAAMGK